MTRLRVPSFKGRSISGRQARDQFQLVVTRLADGDSTKAEGMAVMKQILVEAKADATRLLKSASEQAHRDGAELKDWIARRDPALGSAMDDTRTQCVVNQVVVRDLSASVCDQDEIAFLPPMSGG